MSLKSELSRVSKIWILFILTAAFYMRQLLNIFNSIAGREYLTYVVWFFFLLAFVFTFKALREFSSKLNFSFAFVFLLGLSIAATLELPEERVHIVKYGILGWLLALDFSFHPRASARLIIPVIGGLLCAIVDESIQAMLPYRVGDVRDVGFGLIGSLWGSLLCYTANLGFKPKSAN